MSNTATLPEFSMYIELVVPTYPCNFRCHYCYIGQHLSDKERAKVDPFEFSPQELADILHKKLQGQKAVLNFCSHGETIILPRNVEYIKAMLQAGHVVMIVSNMSQTKAIDDLLTLPPDQLDRLFFKCSFHWLELQRLNLLETFTANVNKARAAGASITVEITPSDELEPHIPQIIQYSRQHFGALPHITVPRNELDGYSLLSEHSLPEYERIWGVFDSELFRFKLHTWHKKVRDFCYAGAWGYSINMGNGEIYRCSSRGHIGNLRDPGPMPQQPAACKCPFPHCYNSHFWLTFGMVPDLPAPNYAAMRDRTCADGSHWLSPTVTRAFGTAAPQFRKPYGKWRKWLANKRVRKHHSLWWHIKHFKF